MAQLNPRFEKLETAYIFPVIEKKLTEFKSENPERRILKLGIGDISIPLAPKIAEAISLAAREMTEKTIGYGPGNGHLFLREAICNNEYSDYDISPDEIFVSDGAKADTSALLDLFSEDCTVAITDPTYPVYRDATLLSGKKLLTLPLREEDGFIPKPPKQHADIVYICSPCNPTGVVFTKENLEEWIDWAKKHKSLLVIDSVYSAFRSSSKIPSSIYALKGSREVAIEIQSFSKSAGFTGLRCGYMVIPKTLHIPEIHKLWTTRSSITRNGVAYPIQKGAAACYSSEGKKQIEEQIEVYRSSAKILRTTLEELDQTFFGGVHAPYIWWKAPDNMSSWEFFDKLLETTGIVTVPGIGFGPSGDGYIRLSSFLSNELAKEASNALRHYFVTA